MSLIRIQRERRQGGGGPSKPTALWKLIAGLALVLILIWYLSRLM
jgi:flagellar biogenesis protein FliO